MLVAELDELFRLNFLQIFGLLRSNSFLSGANAQKEDHTNRHNNSEEGVDDAPPTLPPPIRVVVTKGAEDVTIKVCDRGGGLKRSKLKEIWSFAHSTLTEEGRTR